MKEKNYYYIIFLLLIGFLAYFLYEIFFTSYGFIFDFLLFIFVLYFYYWNYTKKKLKLSHLFFVTSIIFILLNIIGYTVYLGEIRLYDYWLNDYFRFDNIIHYFGAILLVTYSYYYLYPYFKHDSKLNRRIYSLNLIFLILGLGAFHEIIELGGVIFFDAGDKIGDYLNNALDLFYNFLGGITAIFLNKK